VSKHPPLYHQGKSNVIYVWQVWTEGADIVTSYGQVDGKKQLARKTAKPKNVGKRNETSAEEQAEKEAEALYKNKLDRKYETTIEAATAVVPKPMLASPWEKRWGKNFTEESFPVHVQPKLDGIRLMAYWQGDNLVTIGRSGKEINLPHIRMFLMENLPKTLILDGELYQHGKTFQEITSAVKRYQPGITDQIEYYIYDVVDKNNKLDTQSKREIMLSFLYAQFLGLTPIPIKKTETLTAHTLQEVFDYHADFLMEGYEGTIIRLFDSKYQFGYRSHGLLKLKNFNDDEYEIVAVEEGVGKMKGKAIFVCSTVDGHEFRAVPEGSMEERAKMYENRDSLIGHYLKVRYFEKSDVGVPRFPIGVGVRLDEDMTL